MCKSVHHCEYAVKSILRVLVEEWKSGASLKFGTKSIDFNLVDQFKSRNFGIKCKSGKFVIKPIDLNPELNQSI